MAENKLDSINSIPADIEFEISNYKRKILNANIEIRRYKKRPDLISIFHDASRMSLRIQIKMQFKFLSLN